MNSTTTDTSLPPGTPFELSSTTVPSLETLLQFVSESERRVVFHGVSWSFYQQLVDSIPEGANLQVDFDGTDLEIMALSPIHDVLKKTFSRLIELIADELGIPCIGLGQTTWKRPDVARGLEADDCYYFSPDKLAVADEVIGRWSANVADYPNPNLAIEIDLSPSKIDRAGIYAALNVVEVWRFDGERKRIVIERLSADGTYQSVEMSNFLPVRAVEIERWVLVEDRRAGRIGRGDCVLGRLPSWRRDCRVSEPVGCFLNPPTPLANH